MKIFETLRSLLDTKNGVVYYTDQDQEGNSVTKQRSGKITVVKRNNKITILVNGYAIISDIQRFSQTLFNSIEIVTKKNKSFEVKANFG